MTDTLKNLGQSNPTATTLTAIYTVPAATSATVASVLICNTGGSQTTFRLSWAVGGAADAIKQYLYRDLPITANDTFVLTIGITMAASDELRAYAGNGNLAFNVSGVEVT